MNHDQTPITNDLKRQLAAALGGANNGENSGKNSGATTTAGTTEQLLGNITRIIDAATGIPANQLNEHTTLHDQGIDSLAILDIAVRLEDETGVIITEQDIYDADTIEDLRQTVATKLAENDTANRRQ